MSYEMSERYFKYPTGLVPSVTSSTQFFRIRANLTLTEEELTKSKEFLLDKYQFSDSKLGFIFNGDTLDSIMTRVATKDFTNDWGTLVSEEGMSFYEQVPAVHDNKLFIEKFFDQYFVFRKLDLNAF